MDSDLETQILATAKKVPDVHATKFYKFRSQDQE
jgi:hypothetical protein